jgi:hypothetical protein
VVRRPARTFISPQDIVRGFECACEVDRDHSRGNKESCVPRSSGNSTLKPSRSKRYGKCAELCCRLHSFRCWRLPARPSRLLLMSRNGHRHFIWLAIRPWLGPAAKLLVHNRTHPNMTFIPLTNHRLGRVSPILPLSQRREQSHWWKILALLHR